jgi:hypothetical protein
VKVAQFDDVGDCSGCFRLERLSGGARIHWKAPPSRGLGAFAGGGVCSRTPQARQRVSQDRRSGLRNRLVVSPSVLP